jgi:catechol 2,3-dioxygenase-like lactoylglutathione lyase family enzyme
MGAAQRMDARRSEAKPAPGRIAVQRILHTIHAVRDVHSARKLYQDAFGAIAFAERYHEGEDRDMALLYAANHMIEPMAPRRPDESDTTFARYLGKYGEGLHSFELRIDDAEEAAQICQSHGLTLSTVYPKFFFVKPQSTGGLIVQLCGKPLVNDPHDYRGWRPDWIEGHPSSLRRLRHIACFVRDLEAAGRFFTEVLAGQIVDDERISAPQPGRRLIVLLGDTRVALVAADNPQTGLFAQYFSRPVSGVFSLVWEVDDLDAARAHLNGIGLPRVPSALGLSFAIDPGAMRGARHEFTLSS